MSRFHLIISHFLFGCCLLACKEEMQGLNSSASAAEDGATRGERGDVYPYPAEVGPQGPTYRQAESTSILCMRLTTLFFGYCRRVNSALQGRLSPHLLRSLHHFESYRTTNRTRTWAASGMSRWPPAWSPTLMVSDNRFLNNSSHCFFPNLLLFVGMMEEEVEGCTAVRFRITARDSITILHDNKPGEQPMPDMHSFPLPFLKRTRPAS